MKKHNIPPETTDEDLIQAMEALLDQETGDQEAIRAILEELDRRSGAAAFDTDAGWADLQARRKAEAHPRRRRLHRFPIAIAAVLVCLAVSAMAITGHQGLHEAFMEHFGITEESAPLIQDAGVLSDCAVSRHGLTITVKQTVADANGVYVLYEIETPEQVSLYDEHYLQWQNGPSLEISVQGHSVNHAGGGGRLEVLDEHHALSMVYAYDVNQALQPGKLTLSLGNLGYYEDTPGDPDHPTFVPVVEGSWNLSWMFRSIEAGRSISLSEPILWQGMSYPYERISLTPLSLSVFGKYGTGPVENSPFGFDYPPVSLIYQDGTVLPLEKDGLKTYSAGASFNGENYDLHIFTQFDKILDPDQVAGVQVGNQTFYFS